MRELLAAAVYAGVWVPIGFALRRHLRKDV